MDWGQVNAVDLIGLFATIGLLAVTAWYARTTKMMADTAKKAADLSAAATAAAERSAIAARDAATVAQSQIRPEFNGRLIPAVDQDDEGNRLGSSLCIHLKSTGDAVVVQEVRIRRAFRHAAESDKSELVGELLIPFTPDSKMPTRLHYGEMLLLSHPAIQDGGFDRFILDVRYTFAEHGGAGGRRNLVVSSSSPW